MKRAFQKALAWTDATNTTRTTRLQRQACGNTARLFWQPYIILKPFTSANIYAVTYLLTYMIITTRLSGIGLPQGFSPGTSSLRAPPPNAHTKQSQGLFNLVFPFHQWPLTTSSNIRLEVASSSVRMIWPSQHNRWILRRLATPCHWRGHTASVWFGYGGHRQLFYIRLSKKSCIR